MGTKIIYKYRIEQYEGTLQLPKSAKILHFALQHNTGLCIWALVNPDEQQMSIRRYSLVGTGHQLEKYFYTPQPDDYIGTVLTPGGYVWHLFIEPEVQEWSK